MKDNFSSSITENLKPYILPKNWTWFFWEDIMQSYQQGMIRSNSQLGCGNVEYLKMGDIDSSGTADLSKLKRSEATSKEILEYELKQGDFLINVRNSLSLVGKTCVIDELNHGKTLYNHMLVRIDNGSVDMNYFINAFLNVPSSKKMLDRIKEGTTTVIALYQRELNKLPIALPDSVTFNSIVKFYKELRLKIDLNNKINAELEAMAKLIYDYWFVQFDFPDENGKPYKTSGGRMVYNKELNRDIPDGWESGELTDIANITMGQSPPGNSYNEEGVGEVFYQGCTDFGGRFPTNRKFTTKPSRFAKKGDILLSVRAPVGTMNVANEDCCIGRGLAALNSKDNCISYLDGVLQYMKQIFDRRNSSGTTFGSITKGDLFSLSVVKPNEGILKRFDAIAKPMFDKQNIIGLENQKLAELRDWLLPMLMNGQVRVK